MQPRVLNKMQFMRVALDLAKDAGRDIPVGCVIVKDDSVIAKAVNRREEANDPSAHAEILALREASAKLKNWRLDGCEMYVTLEPCPMCAWAVLNSRVSKVYFGAYDDNYGAFGSKLDLCELQNSKVEVYGGILEDECKTLLLEYFKALR